MTREEAIRKIEYGLEMETTTPTPFGQLTVVRTEALRMALSALRAQQEWEKNEPLTLEELREMDGEPVWIEAPLPFWAIVSVRGSEVLLTEKYGETAKAAGWIKHHIGLLYRHKPEETAT